MRPETCRRLFPNVLYYHRDEEIVGYLSTNEQLKGVYKFMNAAPKTTVYPFVKRGVEAGTIDLHMIVRYEQADEAGQWEYYYAPDYLTSTDFKEWLEALEISTGIKAEDLFEEILEMTEEAKEDFVIEEFTFSATDHGQWIIF